MEDIIKIEDGSEDDTQSSGKDQQQSARDRSRRGDKGTRFSDAGATRDRSQQKGPSKRVYVSNIPYEYRWQDLKDLFRRIVGTVEFVELFVDEKNKPRGCGIVEFKDPDHVQKALEKMNRYELSGREIVVKEDHNEERDKFGRIGRTGGDGGSIRGGGGGGGGGGGSIRGSTGGGGGGGGGNLNRQGGNRGGGRQNDFMMNNRGGNDGGGGGCGDFDNFNDYNNDSYNTFGLSASFLDSLGVQGPLHTKVFVANLDYKVDEAKLKQVFKLAGRLVSIDLATDKDGNSRGFAVVEYDHPVEAVQSISMFDRQLLYERRMTVRLDRVPEKNEQIKLPEGLASIGIGLGPNGEPLKNVSSTLLQQAQKNLSQSSQQQQQYQQQSSSLNQLSQMGLLNSNPTPVPVAPPINNGSSGMMGSVPNANLSNNLAALNSVVGTLGALSNPLLSSAAASLNSLGLNLGSSVGGGGGNTGGSNQDSNTNYGGNNYSSGLGSGNLGGGNLGGGNLGGGYGSGGGGNNYNSRSDYDLSGNNAIRSYNTQGQDYGMSGGQQQQQQSQMNLSGGGGGGGGGGLGGNGRSGGSTSDTIVIRNLPQSCTWQTLRDKFRDVGEVKFAEIRGQDCGVVRFSKERDAELAIKIMDGSRFENRTVDVSYF